jgi:DNA-binding PadR family transcriptional regulator
MPGKLRCHNPFASCNEDSFDLHRLGSNSKTKPATQNMVAVIREKIYPLAIYPPRIYTRRMANNKAGAPLTPAVLHILLALSTQERHGYGIMKQVESDSQGKVKMGPGTLYGSLGRMIDAGLIRESDKKVDPKMDDERRVYYKITALGQKTLAAELERYREVVAVSKRLSPQRS